MNYRFWSQISKVEITNTIYRKNRIEAQEKHLSAHNWETNAFLFKAGSNYTFNPVGYLERRVPYRLAPACSNNCTISLNPLSRACFRGVTC